MPRIRKCVPLVLGSLLVCFMGSGKATELRTDSASTAVSPESQESRTSRTAVVEWFKRYDQIRRDAEMTMGDKLQSMRLTAVRSGEKNVALASRMKRKYATALAEMKALPPVSETAELQEGYVQYFNKASQLISEYIEGQEKSPHIHESLVSLKKQLEVLDKSNKSLDEKLRLQFQIRKHKHI